MAHMFINDLTNKKKIIDNGVPSRGALKNEFEIYRHDESCKIVPCENSSLILSQVNYNYHKSKVISCISLMKIYQCDHCWDENYHCDKKVLLFFDGNFRLW